MFSMLKIDFKCFFDQDQDETDQRGTPHEREEDKEKDAQRGEASEVEEEEEEGLPLSISKVISQKLKRKK